MVIRTGCAQGTRVASEVTPEFPSEGTLEVRGKSY